MLRGILQTVSSWIETQRIKYGDPALYHYLIAFTDDDPHDKE